MLEEHDRVVLTEDVSGHGLKSGDVGTIVHVHRGGRAFGEHVRLSGLRRRTEPRRAGGFQASGRQDEDVRFSIYQRQNLVDECDFSCGIVHLPPGGGPLVLARYNGPGHAHGDIVYRAHIHRASERAIAAGRKPESEAEETDRFKTVEGALACLIEDFNVSGLTVRPDEPRLFGDA